MKKLIYLTVLFFCVLLNAQTTEMNIAYGEHPQQMYDITFPENWNQNTPWVINIHGGGWWAPHRQRAYYRGWVNLFAQESQFIVINMDYRLLVRDTESYVFPDQINDIQSVIQHAKQNYGLYNNPLWLMGNSAGAHLSSWSYLNQIEDIEGSIHITGFWNATVPHRNSILFNVIDKWIREQAVSPFVDLEGYSIPEYVSPATFANPELDKILAFFGTSDGEVPISQLQYMLEDYPNLEYVENSGGHNFWKSNAYKYEVINRIISFIETNTEIETDNCPVPTNFIITRTSHTTATLDGDNRYTYQGTANKAGRPLRPYPMYGMVDITVPHTQYGLSASVDYDVWLRTICSDGTYSEWSEPFYLPLYVEETENYYNINGNFIGNDYLAIPRGYYFIKDKNKFKKMFKK